MRGHTGDSRFPCLLCKTCMEVVWSDFIDGEQTTNWYQIFVHSGFFSRKVNNNIHDYDTIHFTLAGHSHSITNHRHYYLKPLGGRGEFRTEKTQVSTKHIRVIQYKSHRANALVTGVKAWWKPQVNHRKSLVRVPTENTLTFHNRESSKKRYNPFFGIFFCRLQFTMGATS